jgi:hypothetical protein
MEQYIVRVEQLKGVNIAPAPAPTPASYGGGGGGRAMDDAAIHQSVQNGLVRIRSARTKEDALEVAEQMMVLHRRSSLAPKLRALVSDVAKRAMSRGEELKRQDDMTKALLSSAGPGPEPEPEPEPEPAVARQIPAPAVDTAFAARAEQKKLAGGRPDPTRHRPCPGVGDVNVRSAASVLWSFDSGHGKFRPMSREIAGQVETSRKQGRHRFRLQTMFGEYDYDLDAMTQTRVDTAMVRRIER